MKVFIFVFSFTCLLISSIIAQKADPLFPNSVVSNDIDFILDTDPDAFVSLAFLGRADKEMPSSLNDNLFDEDTFIFEATFSNGFQLEIWCHSSFGTQEAAQEYADKVCPRLGKLPEIQRDMLDHVVIHNDDATAFAETEGHFFVLYSDNMDDRISTHDLEETVFHETVHASLQSIYENSEEWIAAQEADNCFITEYAKNLPHLEDMPETALFAYTMLKNPGRLSEEIDNWITTNIPNKLAFFGMVYGFVGMQGQSFESEDIMLYPNPAINEISIKAKGLEQKRSIQIYNSTGKLVKVLKSPKTINVIELGDFPNGIYVINIEGFDSKRFIKH